MRTTFIRAEIEDTLLHVAQGMKLARIRTLEPSADPSTRKAGDAQAQGTIEDPSGSRSARACVLPAR
jgi:hypothetical protein